MKQLIEWIEIKWEYNTCKNVPINKVCYFVKSKFDKDDFTEIWTGYYTCYDGKWVILEIDQTLIKVPLEDFDYYAEVE